MSNWLGRMADSAMNFVGKIGSAITENPIFKGTKFFSSLFFGLPLGAVRLFVIDAPIQLIVKAANIAHVRSFSTLWKTDEKKFDPFYQDLSDRAEKMTKNFISGFMFGAWLDIANTAKGWMEDYQSENFGTSKTPGAVNSKENLAAINPAAGKAFISDEIKKVSTAKVDRMIPSPIFTPTFLQKINEKPEPVKQAFENTKGLHLNLNTTPSQGRGA